MSQLDYLDSTWHIGPVMMPAHDAITFSRIMFMYKELAGLELELNSYSFLPATHALVCDAIWKSCPDFFNSELEPLGDVCEQKYYTKFIVRSALYWCICQCIGSVLVFHNDSPQIENPHPYYLSFLFASEAKEFMSEITRGIEIPSVRSR